MENYHQNLESDYEASASSRPINLKLIFSDDEVNSPVFTKQKITGKNGGNDPSIRVILVDADSLQQVTTGPEASANVKLVLVNGHYDATTMEAGEFEKKIVVNWGKKRNLLQGDVDVNLKHGSGTVGEIRIQHDKNPIKTVEFRLGAMVVDCRFEVKPAITQPFKVKDRRNAPKSFRSLSLTDEVWQLKNIRRYGAIHKRLEGLNVCSVKDFLNMYHSANRQTLQKVYGAKGKKWETTLNHAKTCNMPYENDSYGEKRIMDDNLSNNDYYTPKPCEHNYYTPKPYENGIYGKEMIMDDNISVNDYYYTPKPYENDNYGKERIMDDNLSNNDDYTPKPYENGSYGKEMIMDDNFSTDDVEEYCHMDIMWFPNQESLPCQDGNCGTSSKEEKGVKAKKRWMKMRAILFSIASFMCGC